MLLKCYTQSGSKFGKPSSGHRTGKGQFHFSPKEGQYQKMFKLPHNLHSFHMLARYCSKSFKQGLNSMWTGNFQMYNLDLEKAEEPEIKLSTSFGSSKKQEFQKNIYFCFIDFAKAFDCVNHDKLWKILKEMGIPDYLTCLLRNLYAG